MKRLNTILIILTGINCIFAGNINPKTEKLSKFITQIIKKYIPDPKMGYEK